MKRFQLHQGIAFPGPKSRLRLTSNGEDQIKRVMDAGAHGVVVPFVNSKEDAQRSVRSTYYPPTGTRGAGLARTHGYGASFSAYKEWLEKHGVVIVMIEHIDAVNNIDEILAVPGVDGFIIGPYDLSASLGFPGEFENTAVMDAIKKVSVSGKSAGMAGGIHVVDPNLELLKYYIDLGFTFIGYGMDIRFLDTICRDHLKKIKKFR